MIFFTGINSWICHCPLPIYRTKIGASTVASTPGPIVLAAALFIEQTQDLELVSIAADGFNFLKPICNDNIIILDKVNHPSFGRIHV